MIYHILKQLRPERGDQYYRDKSNRGRGTICGINMEEIPNSYSLAWSDRKRVGRWIHPEHGVMIPCPKCVELVKADSKNEGRHPKGE